MEQKIKLTKEQEAELPKFIEKWTKIGLSTEPANRPEAEKWVKEAYKVAGLEEPKHILWADSPNAGHELHCKLRGSRDWITPIYCQHDAGSLSFYDIFQSIGVDVTQITPLTELAKHCGWVWVFRYAAICTERPRKIHVNEDGRLHCVDDRAIEYPDGWGFSAINGTVVPDKVVLDPEGFTKEEIMALNNTEVVRALAERMGWEKYIEKLGAKIIDSQIDPKTGLKYELLESENRFGNLEPRFLRKQSSVLHDGTQPWYIETVHPELETAMAARKFQAMSSFVDNDENELQKLIQFCNKNPELNYSHEA